MPGVGIMFTKRGLIITVCAGMAVVAIGTWASDFAVGQPGFPPVDPTGKGAKTNASASGLSSIKILEDSRFRQVVNVGRDCIKDKEWNQAVQALQAVLNEKTDNFVQITETDASGRENARWTSVKFEANNLIGSMLIEGLQTYEVAYGAEAKGLLDEAKRAGNNEALKEVAQRFRHTKAGIEANEILATLDLARGQVFTAALKYEQILSMNPDWAKVSDITLFKASLAYYRAGNKKNYDETWKRLQANLQGKPGLQVGEDVVPMAKLEDTLKETVVVSDVNVFDWPSWRGNNKNAAQANGSPPLLDATLFRRPMFRDKIEGVNEEDPDQTMEQRVTTVIKQMTDANIPVMPGFFPIASQGIMVYRNHRGLVGVALKKIKQEHDGVAYTFEPGQIVWKTLEMKRSLGKLTLDTKTRPRIESWLDSYIQVPGFGSFLFDNTAIGTMATDHRLVYAIDDMAVPPHPQMFSGMMFNQPQQQFNGQDIKKEYVDQNVLGAYDLHTGRLVWDLNEKDSAFTDSHFISLPISIGGKLYVLNEKQIPQPGGANINNPFMGRQMNQYPGEADLRLVCIDPTKLEKAGGDPRSQKPTIVAVQSLGTVTQDTRYFQDIPRRVNGIQLAYGEGVLVCPTNAGEVFGIDLMTRSLVWSYPYRDTAHQMIQLTPNNPNIGIRPGMVMPATTTLVSKWKSSPPAIHDGRIVFTAPDADSIHCVNLRDGKPQWKRKQDEGDLYFAGVFQGRAIIVGRNAVRALDVKTGSQVWSIHTGDFPSGQGVASKGIYYLPLKRGEIMAFDIERGQIKARNRAAVQGSAPGNLVFYEDMVLSQTATEIVAYPQLSMKLDLAKTDSTSDPENLTKLTDYGELLLKDGQVGSAVERLLKAYQRTPADPLAKRVKERLFEAITDLMQVDFEAAAKEHLTVYQSLCVVPADNAEEQRRKSTFHRLMGEGREKQGNLVEAFQHYKEFGALPLHRTQGGISAPEDSTVKVPVGVWLRGRIGGMLAKATPQQREPLEVKIADEWKAVEAKKDVEQYRSFVGMFDVPFRVGREARIRLAESLMDGSDRTAFLEAELYLHQVLGSEFRAEPASGGRALASLARLEEKKTTVESMRLAASYYRELGQHFANAPVRGDKTGADLVSELAADKRFLPFLEEIRNPFGTAKIAARDLVPGQYQPLASASIVLLPAGEPNGFAKQNRLMLEANAFNPKLIMREIGADKNRWDITLGNVQMNQMIFPHLYGPTNPNTGQPAAYLPNARHRFYHSKGHLVVCQVGVMIYCFEGDTGKKLWEMQTTEIVQNNGFVHLQQVVTDAEGNPEFMYWNQLNNQRFRVQIGRIGTVQSSYVAVLSQKGMTVVEPLTGKTMWKRNDVGLNSHVFGDDQYLFIADANEGGAVGVGRVFRANDGQIMQIPDFSAAFSNRVRVIDRQILSAQSSRNDFTLRLYDIVKGKDAWTKNFAANSFVLQTEDSAITGVIEPDGKLTVLDSRTGKELVATNIAIGGRVNVEDLRNLRNPLLLQDSDRFYVALNRPVDFGKVNQGQIFNNFNNATRCLPVNGWVVAVHKNDGQRKAQDRVITWKKGDLAWHSQTPIANQLLVVDNFDVSPALIFTTRYIQINPKTGNTWVSVTQSISKTNGKWVYDSGPRNFNGAAPMFSTFQIDLKTRSVNLIGLGGAVQHYIDDGKAPPPLQGAMLNAPGGFAGNPAFPPDDPKLIANPVFPGIVQPVIRVPIRKAAPLPVRPK